MNRPLRIWHVLFLLKHLKESINGLFIHTIAWAINIMVRLCWNESESDITSRWAHRESNLMLTLSIDKDEKNNLISHLLLLNVNEPLLLQLVSMWAYSQQSFLYYFKWLYIMLAQKVDLNKDQFQRLVIHSRNSLFTLLDSDTDSNSHSYCKMNGYILLCRTFHRAQSLNQIPILIANYRNRFRIRFRICECK